VYTAIASATAVLAPALVVGCLSSIRAALSGQSRGASALPLVGATLLCLVSVADSAAILNFAWDLEGTNATGNVTITDSVGGITATLSGGATRTATGVVLDGTGAIDFPTLTFGGALTVELVAKFNKFTALVQNHSCGGRIFECGATNGSDRLWIGEGGGSANLWAIEQGTSVKRLTTASRPFAAGQRYHIVATVVGAVQTVYINGLSAANKGDGFEPNVVSREKCALGKSFWTSCDGMTSMKGEVSTLKIYSGAMTQAEVAAAYEAAFPILEFFWDFTGAGGNAVTDSIDGVAATLMGGATRSTTGVVFDGVNGYIDLVLDAKIIGGPMTVVMEIKWNAIQPSSTASMIQQCYTMTRNDGRPDHHKGVCGCDFFFGGRPPASPTIASCGSRCSDGTCATGNGNYPGYCRNGCGHAKTIADLAHGERLFDCGNGVLVARGESPRPSKSTDNIIFVASYDTTSSGSTGGDVEHLSGLEWITRQGSTDTIASSPSTTNLSIGVRYHIVATVSKKNGTAFYIDGVKKGENTAGWEPTAMKRSQCYIGKSNWGSQGYLSGEVSSLKLYSGAMTQAQDTAAYESASPFLEFHWDFTNAANDTIVDSIGGIVATLTNVEASDRTATGIVLDGVDDHLVLNLSTVTLGGPMTVEGVIVWNAFNHEARLFDCGNGQASDNIIVATVLDRGQLNWRVYQGSAAKDISSGSVVDLTLGVRYHIVTTVMGTTMRSYINGVKMGEKTDGWEPTAMTRSTCYVGKSNWATDGYLNGTVSSLKLYSGAMTQADVSTMCANAQICTFSPTASPTTAPTTSTPTYAPTYAPTSTPTYAPTSTPTAAPTAAPTSALDACFATRAATPIDLPEYVGSRPDTIAITAATIGACFSGTAAGASSITIACETDTPLRTSISPPSVVIGIDDTQEPRASFALAANPDATNEVSAPRVPFTLTCRVEETPGKGVIKFRGNVEPVNQPTIGGFCVDFIEGYCERAGVGGIVPSVVSSGGNNITLFASAFALPGLTFDGSTIITINGTVCRINRVNPTGRSITFVTPTLEAVGEGYKSVEIYNGAFGSKVPGSLCWDERCASDRCSVESGSLCPALPLKQRGIFFTKTCVGVNRMGVQFPPPTDPRCVSNVEDVASDACSWGWGDSCRQCPVGCRCPGGPRCWALPGFWIDSIASSGTPQACEPLAAAKKRCLGYNTVTGEASECGMNHAGYLCASFVCLCACFPISLTHRSFVLSSSFSPTHWQALDARRVTIERKAIVPSVLRLK
jgi:hypothetical protein